MKRDKFIKHLEAHNCPLHRHGSRHDIHKNELTGKRTSVPRHGDIDEENLQAAWHSESVSARFTARLQACDLSTLSLGSLV